MSPFLSVCYVPAVKVFEAFTNYTIFHDKYPFHDIKYTEYGFSASDFESERDKRRHLPLLSSRCTGYRFFCSTCWDKAEFEQDQRKKKEQRKERRKF